MYVVEFYENRNGSQPVRDILIELRNKAHGNKDARIQYQKILIYIRALEEYGTHIGELQVKHLDGMLWELRPLAHRFIFFHWRDNKLILLHHFIKMTQKTPRREINQAVRNMNDFIERNKYNE